MYSILESKKIEKSVLLFWKQKYQLNFHSIVKRACENEYQKLISWLNVPDPLWNDGPILFQ